MFTNLSDGNGSDEEESKSPPIRLESENWNASLQRHLMEAVRMETLNAENTEKILTLLYSIAEVTEPMLRSELMEQIPQLAVICDSDFGRRQRILEGHILPIVLRFLADSDPQVRKTAQSALLVLIEEDLISQRTVETEVCQFIVELSECGLNNGITLMAKLSQVLGKNATVRLFLDKFAEACCDPDHINVREACAKSFGELCAVLGTEISESRMVPLLCRLCTDKKWSVRKACAQVFMLVSCAVSMETRWNVLTPAFLPLLSDNSIGVRLMAYQVLGAFIATFAEPSATGMAYNSDGELVFIGLEGFEFRVHTRPPRLSLFNTWSVIENEGIDSSPGDEGAGGDAPTVAPLPTPPADDEIDDAFNTFRFWQLPVLDLESVLNDEGIRESLTMLDNELTSLCKKLDKCSSGELRDCDGSVILSDTASTPDSGWNSGVTTPSQHASVPYSFRFGNTPINRVGKKSPTIAPPSQPAQSVVPEELLHRFLNMAQPTQSADTDKELALQCAYFLPAVAYTLGPDNWCCISQLHRSLANDVQWKVRRNIASSLHEMAEMLGEQTASRDLAPILEALLKDLDEVRIGVVEHLAFTLGLFRPAVRNSFLPLLKDLLETDADSKWRFREELASQLLDACSLFSPADCLKYIGPIAFGLLSDKVAAVRKKAVILVTDLIDILSTEPHFRCALLDYVFEEFLDHSVWWRRVVYAQLCSEVASRKALDSEQFCISLLPSLLRLANDRVPNVRLSVARCLSETLIKSDYIPRDNSHREEILTALQVLSLDSDSDVRLIACWEDSVENVEETPVPTSELHDSLNDTAEGDTLPAAE